METPGRTCQRLIAALEHLVAEEQCLLRIGEIEKVRAVQLRADSIITRLAELADSRGATARDVEPLRPRLATLQARRAETIKSMDSRLAEMRASLASMNATQVRLDKMRNSYCAPSRANRPAVSKVSFSA
jgi:hypothetical protein